MMSGDSGMNYGFSNAMGHGDGAGGVFGANGSLGGFTGGSGGGSRAQRMGVVDAGLESVADLYPTPQQARSISAPSSFEGVGPGQGTGMAAPNDLMTLLGKSGGGSVPASAAGAAPSLASMIQDPSISSIGPAGAVPPDAVPFDMSEFPALAAKKGMSNSLGALMGEQGPATSRFFGAPGAADGVVGPPSSLAASMSISATSALAAAMSASGTGLPKEDFPALPTASASEDIPRGLGVGAPGQSHQKGGKASTPTSDQSQFGLLGLLKVIRMTDPDLNTLALGSDLTTLGLNLNSSKSLYATFSSPWVDGPSKSEPQFQIPACYYMQQTPPLKHAHLQKFQLETLFYIFYAMPKDLLQVYAARELYQRDWKYHGDLKLWFRRATQHDIPHLLANSPPQFVYFDLNTWECRLFSGNIHGAFANGFMKEEEAVAALPQAPPATSSS